MLSMEKTPLSLGYFMPAEWAPHEATWISWPKDPLTFPKKIIASVERTYCGMVAGLQQGEKVKILVDDEKQAGIAEKKLKNFGASSDNVIFVKAKSVDVWMRDYGPTFLLNKKGGKRAAIRWIFNAWGSKYDDLLEDNRTGDSIASMVAEENGGEAEFPVFRPGIVIEGGSIDANGEGMLLTTEQCLLNRNRNPQLGKGQIEGILKDNLGVSNVIWLKNGIEGDDTDGHVDDFARFVGKGAVVCAQEGGNGPNHAALEENHRILANAGLEVIGLPMPSPIIEKEESRRLPARYANFSIGNKAVLMPSFGDANDKKAAEILQQCFPKKEIVPIPCRELVYGYGGLHCVTQQEPKI